MQAQKEKLHQYIKQSDLRGLKIYVDLLQTSLVNFDDPSLLLMAIKIYLDPHALIEDKKLQFEIILFLAKSGLLFYLPGGTLIIKIYQYWNPQISTHDEFNQELHLLFDQILKEGHTELLRNIIPPQFKDSPIIIEHRSAIKIQRTLRRFQSRSKQSQPTTLNNIQK